MSGDATCEEHVVKNNRAERGETGNGSRNGLTFGNQGRLNKVIASSFVKEHRGAGVSVQGQAQGLHASKCSLIPDTLWPLPTPKHCRCSSRTQSTTRWSPALQGPQSTTYLNPCVELQAQSAKNCWGSLSKNNKNTNMQ